MTRILITGGAGQVGIELARLPWPEGIEIVTPTRDELNLVDPASIARIFASGPWHCVINSAAYTAVDAAEDNVGDAFLANAQGPAWLAEAAAKAGSAFIQLSTDYVFDGTHEGAYREEDPIAPIGSYGASKLAGELAVHAAHPRAVIMRTAWVLSAHRANFLKTMLRLGAERDRLSVVADQHGCPTSAADIAGALHVMAMRLIRDPEAPAGIHHFVNAGSASWHELAQHIFTIAAANGWRVPELAAITTAEYPTRARRPHNSRLDTARISENFGITPRPWQDAVREIVEEYIETRGLEKSA